MHPCPGSRAGHDFQTAIEQRVIGLKTKIDPTPFGKTLIGLLQLHVGGGFSYRPGRKTKPRLPNMVVGKLKQVHFVGCGNGQRPRPRVLFQIGKAPLGAHFLHKGGQRGHAVIVDSRHANAKDRAQRVGFVFDGEDFKLGIIRMNQMVFIQPQCFDFPSNTLSNPVS